MQAKPQLSFIEAIKVCFAKYANFKGRGRRSEFWWFYLFGMIVNWILLLPVYFLNAKKQAMIADAEASILSGGNVDMAALEANDPTSTIIFLLIVAGIVMLILLLPTLAAWVRRLHDVGKSGHMLWLFLLCGVGGLIPLLMCIPDGKPEPNKYGESPKYVQV